MASTTRWIITDYQHNWLESVLYVWCWTDIPCHMTLLYTDKPVRLHIRAAPRRGHPELRIPDYCFVEYKTIEQNEPGDTLKHTFDWPGWADGLEFSFRFEATINALPTVSQSPIWHITYLQYGIFEIGIYDNPLSLVQNVHLEAGSGIMLEYDPDQEIIIVSAPV